MLAERTRDLVRRIVRSLTHNEAFCAKARSAAGRRVQGRVPVVADGTFLHVREDEDQGDPLLEM